MSQQTRTVDREHGALTCVTQPSVQDSSVTLRVFYSVRFALMCQAQMFLIDGNLDLILSPYCDFHL